MATVALDGVTKTYPNGAVALAGVTLSIADAEVVVLVGPSGCGKSTLLRVVAGLEKPTQGTVRIGERVVNGLAPQERNVAMVFQDYALYPHLTVHGNLAFPLRMRRLAAAEVEARVAHTAEMLGLGPLLGRLPRQLSGGQRQRVAMGRALVRDPSVFLLDEPLSNLDAKLRGQVRTDIEALQRRTRTTMLYVTHDQVEAMTLGHRIAVLDQGRLRQIGPAREIYEHPANTFVAGFIGSPPMNLFPVRVETAARTARLCIGSQHVPVRSERLAGAVAGPAFAGPLTAGVRPEALRLTAPDDPDVLVARVGQSEALGHESLVYLPVENEMLVARLNGMEVPARDQTVGIVLDLDRLYLFDAAGEALWAPNVTTT
jgi:multiple sugar transport system ATP-binding protein